MMMVLGLWEFAVGRLKFESLVVATLRPRSACWVDGVGGLWYRGRPD